MRSIPYKNIQAVAFVDTAVPPPCHGFPWCGPLPSVPPPLGAGADDRRPLVPWTPDLSAALYKVDGWGAPYFAVNAAGDVAVRPHGAATLPAQEIDLFRVIRTAVAGEADGGLGLSPPLVVRFPDVLRHRLESLHGAFDAAIAAAGYGAHYQGVYPVKCNQDRRIVEDVVAFGARLRFGLEAGSKPELLLAMSCLADGGSSEAFLVCNGYKDDEYITLALVAQALGLNPVIVLEQEEELDVVLEAARRLSMRPVIGLRAKLRTKHDGHFGDTSGENGKFGLTVKQILAVVAKLRGHGMLDCLQLLHFHIGSQIPTTALLADCVGEATQVYCELVRLGAAMRVIDVGGGLGIDYDGSRSGETDMSVAYNLEEYAAAVVRAVRHVCDLRGVAHPVLCSESGRALVSHHSVLVFEAVAAPAAPPAEPGTDLAIVLDELSGEARHDYRNLVVAAKRVEKEMCGLYIEQLKRHSVEQFKDGALGLENLVAIDELCDIVGRQFGAAEKPRKYHANLSVFTSMPDAWAIQQLFPIMPIHRLTEQPSVSAVLSDLTCDSDGKVDRFIGDKPSLPLHEPAGGGGGEHYYLGMFLGGAYQEALGGMHNLFGRAAVVRVAPDGGPAGFRAAAASPGQSCADAVRAAQHDPERMLEALKRRAAERGARAAVAGALARAFGSTPYLVLAADCGGDMAGSGLEAAEGGGRGDEEEWEFVHRVHKD